MIKKDVIKSLIAIKQSEIPFDVIVRKEKLPIDSKKIITIPGVRRCGKSTMMEIAINDLIKNGVKAEQILWLGFDDERLVNMDSDELNQIIESYMEMYPDISLNDVYMFFDEIQLIKNWEYFILRLYKNYCKNIFICGSNATMLSTELSSALRGYPVEYKVYPLSFYEYCQFNSIKTQSYLEQDVARLKNAFLKYNTESSFPEIVLAKSKSEQLKLLHGYFDTMLLKDVAEHYKISNISLLRYFVKRIMENLSKPTSINSIYNDIKSQGAKVSKDDLYLWANYVCNIFLFIRIPKYERSLSKEQKSLNKYYCIDNGLRSAVLLPQSNDNGKYLENSVLLHLNRNKHLYDKITYFQGNYECDFVVQRMEDVVELIQVCWDISEKETLKREIRGLLEASKITNCDNLNIITIEEERTIQIEEKMINIIPAWKWMMQ